MLQLHNLEPTTKKRKRIGRGGSRGGQSGRGHKGQRARSGSRSELKPFFEGGQMPLSRRLPRRGFTNSFKKEFVILNVCDLETFFQTGDEVTKNALKDKGLIKGKKLPLVKILGKGTLSKQLTVHADAFSKSAIQQIKKAKGKAQLVKETGRVSDVS